MRCSSATGAPNPLRKLTTRERMRRRRQRTVGHQQRRPDRCGGSVLESASTALNQTRRLSVWWGMIFPKTGSHFSGSCPRLARVNDTALEQDRAGGVIDDVIEERSV